MNERIKELAEQADDFTDNEIQMQGEYHPDWHDIRDQKFAQLIVKECVNINQQELSFNAFEQLMNRYNDHFGVEL